MKKLILITASLMAFTCGTANAAIYVQPVIVEEAPPVYYAPPAPVIVDPAPIVVVRPRTYGYVERHHHYDWAYWRNHRDVHPVPDHFDHGRR